MMLIKCNLFILFIPFRNDNVDLCYATFRMPEVAFYFFL